MCSPPLALVRGQVAIREVNPSSTIGRYVLNVRLLSFRTRNSNQTVSASLLDRIAVSVRAKTHVELYRGTLGIAIREALNVCFWRGVCGSLHGTDNVVTIESDLFKKDQEMVLRGPVRYVAV